MAEYVYDWSDYYWASNTLLATITNLDGFHGRMQLMLRQWICGYNEVSLPLPSSMIGKQCHRLAPMVFLNLADPLCTMHRGLDT